MTVKHYRIDKLRFVCAIVGGVGAEIFILFSFN